MAGALAQPSAPALAGGSAPAMLHVSAEVSPSGVFRFETRRSVIEVSEADVKRGFVEIAAGSLLHMETGRLTPEVVVEFRPDSGPFKTVEMRTHTGWLAADGTRRLDPAYLDLLPPTGAVRPSDPLAPLPAASSLGPAPGAERPGSVAAAVSWRFILDEKTAPGFYPLPLTLNIGM